MWVWALAVVEGHSIADHAQGMHLRFEAVPVNALFLQGTYHSFQHAVVMRAVRWRGLLRIGRTPLHHHVDQIADAAMRFQRVPERHPANDAVGVLASVALAL